jgi:uncharacterized protein YybS (DUF2232 family)
MNFRAILIAALQTAGLYVAGLLIPLLGQALALFTPVPVIVVSLRYGRREGVAALVAAGLLATLLGGILSGVLFFFSFGLMALGTAEGIRRTLKPEQTALLGGMLPIAAIGLFIIYFFITTGKNPLTAVEAYIHTSVAEAAKLYTDIGLREMSTMIQSVPDKFIYYLVRLLPGITIVTSLTQAACCYAIARLVLARKPGATPVSGPSFGAWHAPDAWVWGLIAALTFVIVPHETLRLIGWNLVIIFGTIYLIQGTAIVEHYLKKARIRPFLRGFIIALILALPLVVFVTALGIVDIWADVRKVRGPFPS